MTRLSIVDRAFGRRPGGQVGQASRTRAKRLAPGVEGLEHRALLSGGSVVQSGTRVTITPDPSGPNVAEVSYQIQNGRRMLDVNLNGTDHYYSLTQVGFVYYRGTGIGGAQTFVNTTALHTIAWGGTGNNRFVAGAGQDQFYGGSGSNTFIAGTGYDVLVGGTGPNVFYGSATGSGQIIRVGTSNTVSLADNGSGHYIVT